MGSNQTQRGVYKIGLDLMITWLLVLLISTAYAHDPSEEFSNYYNSLKRPNANPWEYQGCCQMSHDCFPTSAKMEHGQYYALMDKQWGVNPPEWVLVPPEVIIKHTPNPTKQPTLCAPQTYSGNKNILIYCFNPSDEY